VEKLSSQKNIGGFYIPRAEGSVAIIPRSTGADSKFEVGAETVLLHEYSHHFMMQNFAGAYPAWFIEGFAEFASTVLWGRDGSANFGAPANHRAYGLVSGNPLPLDKLLDTSEMKLNDRQREAIYGRGWLLTHYLMFEPARKGQLSNYIVRLNKGEPSLEAGKAVFGDFKALDRELNSYLRRSTMMSLRLKPEDLPTGQIQIRDLPGSEEAMMDVRIVSRRGVNREQALALVPAARRAVLPFPDDAAVQAALAEAEYDAGNLAEAGAAADRAIKANPKFIDGLIYKGRVEMAAAIEAKKFDEPTWKAIRKWFVSANRVDPNDPEPLILFYQSFPAAGVQPTANATLGLVQALALAPQDRGLRLMVAHQYLMDGHGAEARSTLAPIAFDPHGGEARQTAAAVIETIDSAGAKAALERWQTLQKQAAASES
jgi:hypothetical protein